MHTLKTQRFQIGVHDLHALSALRHCQLWHKCLWFLFCVDNKFKWSTAQKTDAPSKFTGISIIEIRNTCKTTHKMTHVIMFTTYYCLCHKRYVTLNIPFSPQIFISTKMSITFSAQPLIEIIKFKKIIWI